MGQTISSSCMSSSRATSSTSEPRALGRVLQDCVSRERIHSPQKKEALKPSELHQENRSPEGAHSKYRKILSSSTSDSSAIYCDKENSPTNEDLPLVDQNFLLTNPKSRMDLYTAFQEQNMSLAKELLFIMVINRYSQPENFEEAYKTIHRLLTDLNGRFKETVPDFTEYSYVDRLCAIEPWHDALMQIFFGELKSAILSPTPQVLRAQFYAVQALENTMSKLLHELCDLLLAERPQLLTPKIKILLNPELAPQTFRQLFFEEITLQIASNLYLRSSAPSIFDLIAYLEAEYLVHNPENSEQHSPEVF